MSAATRLQRARQADAKRFVRGGRRRTIEMHETSKKVHKIEGGDVTHRDVLVLHRRFDEFLEVFRRRFIPNKRPSHVPPHSGAGTRTDASVQGIFRRISGRNCGNYNRN